MKFIKVSNIKINVDESVDKAFEKAIKEAGINNKFIFRFPVKDNNIFPILVIFFYFKTYCI